MTREDLIDIIYKSDKSVTCPDLLEDCDGICETCAEALLEEYENNIAALKINEFITRVEHELQTSTLSRDRTKMFVYAMHSIADTMKGELNAR